MLSGKSQNPWTLVTHSDWCEKWLTIFRAAEGNWNENSGDVGIGVCVCVRVPAPPRNAPPTTPDRKQKLYQYLNPRALCAPLLASLFGSEAEAAGRSPHMVRPPSWFLSSALHHSMRFNQHHFINWKKGVSENSTFTSNQIKLQFTLQHVIRN